MPDNPESLPNDINIEYDKIQKKYGLLPIKVSPFYLKKVNEEINILGHRDGPLTRIVFPNESKINLHVGNEYKDWVDDRKNMIPGLDGFAIRKYTERILILMTETCFSNCQYCFRQDILSNGEVEGLSENDINNIIEYINNNEEITEIIFSGGDPMSVNTNLLDYTLGKIQNNTKIRNFRIHTRSIIYYPDVFSLERIKVLKKYNVRLVFHISHPYEICDKVKEKISDLFNSGIRLYNQFPLLRGINDHYLLLIKHLSLLDDLGIRNLSIFIPDPVKFSASYRIPINRIKEIIKQVSWNSPSWINSTRFLMDSNIGKLRIEDIVEYDETHLVAKFIRNGEFMEYNDFPKELDKPGNIKLLLWKDYIHDFEKRIVKIDSNLQLTTS